MASFTIGASDFLLDGRPHRVLAGAIHYFRVHPDLWADRIHKARQMGLNTIETYVAWNAHEPQRGEWDAAGANDLARFLDLVAAEGMHAIVRPGPFICAEWHNGGFPAWLTSIPDIRLRSADPLYMTEVSTYLRRVYEIVAPRQIDQGGNVILVQIENEYGAYGSDKDYLRELVALTRESGITVPLTTVDQPIEHHLRDGSLPELHSTGSFGSRVPERLTTLREHQATGPLMCSEFWDGWFDWWGGVHHTTSAEAAASELDALLAAGASLNVYMFHGGTNFGLTNGANDKGRYLPIVTSYDYDAPLDEAGRPTAKYWALREVLAKYTEAPADAPEREARAAPELTVPLHARGNWLAAVISGPVEHVDPPTFDALDQPSGVVVYETQLPAFDDSAVLAFGEVRDRAIVSVDGVRVGVLSRTLHERALVIPPGRSLRVIVEEQGRVNYDKRIGELKGLIGGVTLDGTPLNDWSADAVDLTAIAAAAVDGVEGPAAGSAAFVGEFSLEEPADLFLDTAGWGKGFAFVNGFFLGRYWSSGPQRTLYVPGPATRVGANTVVALELDQIVSSTARFVPAALLGATEE